MSHRKLTALLAGITTTCAVGVLLAVLIDGGSATTAPDREATKNYLAARRALETHVARSPAVHRSAAKTYVAGIANMCGGVLKHAPPITGQRRYMHEGSTIVLRPQAVLFSDAASGVEQAARRLDEVAIRRFTREVRGLRWSDSVLTKLVHTLGEIEDAQLEQETPELCRNARTWVASGYKSLAAGTSRTAERLAGLKESLNRALAKEGCVNPYPGRAVLHVLEQTMSSGQSGTAQELSRLEARANAKNEAIVDSAVARIEEVLGSRLHVHSQQVRPVGVLSPCIPVPRTASR
jgi:hypothetical protein